MRGLNIDGRTPKMVLQWLLRREDLKDAEIAEALGVPPSTYSLRKDRANFPTFEELARIGRHFGVSARVLQISFGHRDLDDLLLLTDDEVVQYLDIGGAKHLSYPLEVIDHRKDGAATPNHEVARPGRKPARNVLSTETSPGDDDGRGCADLVSNS